MASQILDPLALEDQSHGTIHDRSFSALENPDQVYTATEPRIARQVQSPRVQVLAQMVRPLGQPVRPHFRRHVHPHRALRRRSALRHPPLAELRAAVEEACRVVALELVRPEVGVLDGQLGDEGRVEGRYGRGRVPEALDVDRSQLDTWRLGPESDEGKDQDHDALQDYGCEDVDEALVVALAPERFERRVFLVAALVGSRRRQRPRLRLLGHMLLLLLLLGR